jgi:hypothetical protein
MNKLSSLALAALLLAPLAALHAADPAAKIKPYTLGIWGQTVFFHAPVSGRRPGKDLPL